MGLLKSVVKFVSDPSPVSRLEDLEEGRAAAEGVVRIEAQDEIISPVNSRPCAAFYYNAMAITVAGKGVIPRKIKTAEVYAPFSLQMDGGLVRAEPARSDAFTAADHRALSGGGHENFRATEDLIPSGTRVRVWGKVRQVDGARVLVYTKIEVLGRAPTETGTGGKKRRKKKSAKKPATK